MDVLSDLVELMRLRGHLYGNLSLGAPFALSFPSDVGHFFIAVEGQCRLAVGDKAPIVLAAGDFVFLPSQEPFCLLSNETSIVLQPRLFSEDEGRSYSEKGLIELAGDMDAGVRLVSGCFRFGPHESSLLTEHLDGPLTFRATGRTASHWMTTMFQMIADEAQPGRPGAFTIVDRLAEVLLIHALRSKMEAGSNSSPSWLGALRDPMIGSAIREMHFAPQKAWSVEALAQSAGMSRSGFAARFRVLTGRTPMEHLANWRMHKAARLLIDNQRLSVGQIVVAVGYQSEAAFRRKFIEVMGLPPAHYRSVHA